MTEAMELCKEFAEFVFLIGVLEPRKNMQNLARLGHFSSNRVGDLFGPQIEGAHPLKAQSSVSQDP